jgi:hypothetical protein
VSPSSLEKNASRRLGVRRSAQSTSAFVQAASRALRTFHIAMASSASPPAASTSATIPVENSLLISASTPSSRPLTALKSS